MQYTLASTSFIADYLLAFGRCTYSPTAASPLIVLHPHLSTPYDHVGRGTRLTSPSSSAGYGPNHNEYIRGSVFFHELTINPSPEWTRLAGPRATSGHFVPRFSPLPPKSQSPTVLSAKSEILMVSGNEEAGGCCWGGGMWARLMGSTDSVDCLGLGQAGMLNLDKGRE